jgi:hypothetical protein
MRCLLVISVLVWLLVPRPAYASAYYFVSATEVRVLPIKEEVEIRMNYDLVGPSAERFLVRPLINNGIISIWHWDKDVYIPGTGLWSDMPRLAEGIKIKIQGLSAEKTELWFQIQDTKKGKVYHTPKTTLWSRVTYIKYVERLNENISMWAVDDTIPE